MPSIEEQIEEIDVQKLPMFKLCEFLLHKRRTLRPISMEMNSILEIPLIELREIFGYFKPGMTDDEKIKKIKEFLDILREQPATDNETVIRVLNTSILGIFLRSFNDGGRLEVRYTSGDLEKYIAKFKEKTEIWKRVIEGFHVEPTSKGGVIVSSGDKSTAWRAQTPPIAAPLIILLSGGAIPMRRGALSIRSVPGDNFYDDYERGDPVEFDFLCELLSLAKNGNIGGHADEEPFTKDQIEDSMRGINKKSKKVFGSAMLRKDGDESILWCFLNQENE